MRLLILNWCSVKHKQGYATSEIACNALTMYIGQPLSPGLLWAKHNCCIHAGGHLTNGIDLQTHYIEYKNTHYEMWMLFRVMQTKNR